MRELLDLVNEWTSDVRDVLKDVMMSINRNVRVSSKMDIEGDNEEEENYAIPWNIVRSRGIPVEDIPEYEMLVAEISVRDWRDSVIQKYHPSSDEIHPLKDLESF